MLQFQCLLLFICLASYSCLNPANKLNEEIPRGTVQNLIRNEGDNIESRFQPPTGYTRNEYEVNSFGYYLRHLPLKPAGSKVYYYNGGIKNNHVYAAVVDMDIGEKNLQQCADAIIRLRAEYLYAINKSDAISFHLTNGFITPYSKWKQGFRVKVTGNNTSWVKVSTPDNSYKNFRAYLDFVFSYAGTLSLSKELKAKPLSSLSIGDVFIKGGSPGHAVIVVDMAENDQGNKMFLLAQSYMPAQEIQVLKNENDPSISPWYRAEIAEKLITPEWTFEVNELKTWPSEY